MLRAVNLLTVIGYLLRPLKQISLNAIIPNLAYGQIEYILFVCCLNFLGEEKNAVHYSSYTRNIVT